MHCAPDAGVGVLLLFSLCSLHVVFVAEEGSDFGDDTFTADSALFSEFCES